MAWKNGKSVAEGDRKEGGTRQTASRSPRPSRALLPKILLDATVLGRRRMADGFFDSDTLLSKVQAGAITSGVLTTLVTVGAFAADAASRALFATGFVSSDLLASSAVTKGKLAGGFLKQSVLTGAAAGAFRLTGISAGDELIYVYEQNGTSGLITDRTSEFMILSEDYISNVGGADTSGDKLLVLYLDLT